nr:hypothetical protein [Allomuricauda sp.]
MKKQLQSLVIGLLMVTSLSAQIKIGDNPEILNPASVLELESTSRVLVITRMTTVQMENTSPLRGALVYNIDTQCVHFYDGTQWINPCDQPDEQTFTADAIVNDNPTIIITEDGTNFNFEVGMIRGENIVPTSINGQVHLQAESITGDRIATNAISFDKLAAGTTTGELLQWTGAQWELVDESALTVTEADGVVGNEVVGPADATLVLSGTGDALSPFLLDVNAGGINTMELANDAVNSLKIEDGQVSNADLATDAVTNDKMANDAVGTTELINGSVTNEKLDKGNIPLSGFAAPTANVDMGGFQINNLQDPSVAQDAATMAYVDAQILISDTADGDTDSNNEIQDLSNSVVTANESVEIQITGGNNTTIDIRDADSDPNNEDQTVSAGTGISVNQVGDDFEVTNTAPDQTVSITDGGSGNVTVGGTYPNFTLDVPDNTDSQDISTDNSPGNITIDNGSTLNLNVNDADSDPNNEDQTVSAGTGISVNQVGDDFEVTNTAPDQTVSITDGGSGNVTVGGTYPNFTLDVPDNTDSQDISTDNSPGNITIDNGSTLNLNVNDADSDPNNEDQTVSAGTGISVNQVGDDFEVTNTAPDQTVSITDGGSGNVTVGGTYPNFTLDVPDNTDSQDLSNSVVTANESVEIQITGGNNTTIDIRDADSDPNNEDQTVSAGTGISVNQVGDDFEVTNTAPDQTVSIADGGSGNVTVGGTYPNFTLDVPDNTDSQDISTDNSPGNITIDNGSTLNLNVNDADSDPNNEDQTVSAGTGISVNQVGDDFEVTNTAPDQTVSITDGGSGNVTVGGTYPNFTLDVPDNTDSQDLSNSVVTANESVEIQITGGNNTTIDIRDADSDPNNEIELPTGGTNGQILSTDGSGGYSWVDDQDDQDASEVDLVTPVDMDEAGETSPTNETTVEEAIQAIAPITSKAARIFYPPSIAVPASSVGAGTPIDLHAAYVAQYGSPAVKSPSAPNGIPTYAANELYYYITYYDTTVFSGVSVTDAGIMSFTVDAVPTGYNSLINVVFVVK